MLHLAILFMMLDRTKIRRVAPIFRVMGDLAVLDFRSTGNGIWCLLIDMSAHCPKKVRPSARISEAIQCIYYTLIIKWSTAAIWGPESIH